MSRTQSSPTDQTCGYCGGPASVPIEGAFCSRRCYRRHRGTKLLDQLRSDHQICATCFGRVKTVAPIHRGPDDVEEGLQYPTEKTTIGVDTFGDDLNPIEATRWSCSCGAVDPATIDVTIQRVHFYEAIANCYNALQYLYKRGAIQTSPSRQRYLDAIAAHPHDARLAVGAAVDS